MNADRARQLINEQGSILVRNGETISRNAVRWLDFEVSSRRIVKETVAEGVRYIAKNAKPASR